MNAVEINKHGGIEVLQLVQVPVPEPAAGEILVKVSAAGVNYTDIGFREGSFYREVPLRLGKEAVGLVEKVGDGVVAFSPGERVGATLIDGAYAEYVAAPAHRWVRIPDELDDVQACASMMQGMTGHYLTQDCCAIGDGNTVLFTAAASGVNSFAIPMAKELGATVIGVVSNADKVDAAVNVGADHVIISSAQDFVAETHKITRGAGVAAAFDSVGAKTFHKVLKTIKPRGTAVLYGAASGPVTSFDTSHWLFYSIYVLSPSIENYIEDPGELTIRATAVFKGIIEQRYRVAIGGVYRLDQVQEAHRALSDPTRVGKIILSP